MTATAHPNEQESAMSDQTIETTDDTTTLRPKVEALVAWHAQTFAGIEYVPADLLRAVLDETATDD
jgi:hypothetical protein